MKNVQRNGPEVVDRILRPLVAFRATALGSLGFFGTLLAILLIVIGVALSYVISVILTVILIPLTFPLDLLLRVLGRKGFLTMTRAGRFSYTVDLEGFRKAP